MFVVSLRTRAQLSQALETAAKNGTNVSQAWPHTLPCYPMLHFMFCLLGVIAMVFPATVYTLSAGARFRGLKGLG